VTRSTVPHHPNVEAVQGLRPNDPALRSLYATCHLFSMPSYAETFGIAAVEAAAAGLPAVVTDVGALSEIVKHDETGFVVPVGEVARLAEALQLLDAHRDLCARFGRAARRRAEAQYSAKSNAERLLELALRSSGRRSPTALGSHPGP
jgi:glycosyltransferase involved in cell wall biosynthesis